MPDRCPICNHKDPNHSIACRAHPSNLTHEAVAERALVTERGVQQTSAERYAAIPVGGDVCGPAAPVDGYPPHRQIGEGGYPVSRYCGHCDEFGHRLEDCPKLRPAGVPDQADWGRIEPAALTTLPTGAAARKELPLASGLLDYFPAALAAVAALSKVGNDQHNPGRPLAWDRSKSGDEADAMLRHFLERGTLDTDGQRHSVKVAWRALALLQKELEAEGLAPLSRGSR